MNDETLCSACGEIERKPNSLHCYFCAEFLDPAPAADAAAEPVKKEPHYCVGWNGRLMIDRRFQ